METTNASWTAWEAERYGEAHGAYRDEDGVPLTYEELAELYRRSEREAEWLTAILCCIVGSLAVVALFLLYSVGALDATFGIMADNARSVAELFGR